MQKLILSDKTEITIQEGASLSNISTIQNSMIDIETLKNKLLKKGNLDKVIFKQDDMVVGEYFDLVLINNQISLIENINGKTTNMDGKILVVFGFREKTDIEKRLDKIEKDQLIQDSAIADLGSVVGASLL